MAWTTQSDVSQAALQFHLFNLFFGCGVSCQREVEHVRQAISLTVKSGVK